MKNKTKLAYALIAMMFFVSCGGSTSGGNAFQQNFEASEPIDIPVTIAKAINPLDARQLSAEFNGADLDIAQLFLAGSGNITKSQVDACDDFTITGQANAASPSSEIRAYSKSGELIDSFSSNADGSFENGFCLDDVPLEDPVALVVMDGDEASYPVIVTLHEESVPFDFNPYSVHITNLTGIREVNPMIAGDDSCVAYSATDSAGEPFVVCVPSVAGGFYETYSSALATALDQIQFSTDSSFLVGVDQLGRVLRINASNGATVVISDSNYIGRTIRLSPDNLYVMTEAYNAGSTSLVHLVFESTTINATNQLTDSIHLNEDTWIADDFDFEWLDTDTVVTFRRYPVDSIEEDAGKYFGQRVELGVSLTSGEDELTIAGVDVFTTDPETRVIRNPRVNPSVSNTFSYECEDEEGVIILCQTDNVFALEFLVSSDFGHNSLSNSRWSIDGTYIIFQASFDNDREVIAAHFPTSQEEYALDLGIVPSPSTFEDGVIGYLSRDYSGQFQVSVLNLTLHPLTSVEF